MSDTSSNAQTGMTCISCKLMFADGASQRHHYRSDFHRYNLKRKVVGLPPVTEQLFNEKVAAKKAAENAEPETFGCDICRKSYNSAKTLETHNKSKKHLLAVEKYEQKQAELEEAGVENVAENVESTKTDEEEKETKPARPDFSKMTEEEIIDYKIETGTKLEVEECLLCGFKSEDIQKNIQHMYVEHGFYVPDIEFITDLNAFIQYLCQKVGIGNACLYCDKAFVDINAVRNHMSALHHFKLPLGCEDDEELYEFYDYDIDTNDGDDDVSDKTDDDDMAKRRALVVQNTVTPQRKPVDIDEYVMTFNDGRVVGHRALHHYYKQNIAPADARAAIVLRKQVVSTYKRIGQVSQSDIIAKKQFIRQRKHQARRQTKQHQQVASSFNKCFIVRPQVLC